MKLRPPTFYFSALFCAIVIASYCPVPLLSGDEVPSVNAVGYVKITLYAGPEYIDFGDATMSNVMLRTGDDLTQIYTGTADQDEVNTVSLDMDCAFTFAGDPPGGNDPASGTLTMVLTNKPSGTETGSFQAEIVSMELSGEDVQSGKLYLIRNDFESIDNGAGQVTISDIGGGLYHIDSFFDVFTELSVDGGDTWLDQISTDARYVLVPEPASLSVLLVLAGVAFLRQR